MCSGGTSCFFHSACPAHTSSRTSRQAALGSGSARNRKSRIEIKMSWRSRHELSGPLRQCRRCDANASCLCLSLAHIRITGVIRINCTGSYHSKCALNIHVTCLIRLNCVLSIWSVHLQLSMVLRRPKISVFHYPCHDGHPLMTLLTTWK